MSRLLEHKVAIITGAGRGIGREHALLFAREGARVVVNDPGCGKDGGGVSEVAREVVGEIESMGGRAVANTDAVGTGEAAENLVRTALETFGRVDILVNSAGILRDRTILNMSGAEWDSVLKVHLRGSFTCLKAVAAAMRDAGHGGSIINTSSISGLLGNFGQANYGAAKAGIHALTRIAAMEFAKHRITVNAIAPIAMTRMMSDLPEAAVERLGDGLAPETVSPLVAFLASERAAHITGVTFGIEGGHLFTYRMMTSHGADSNSPDARWTIDEIGERIDQIIQW